MTDSRLATEALEALTQATPARRLATGSLESLTQATPARRLGTLALLVLVPTVEKAGYSGWGIKL